jgi:hypothetical protein
VPQKPPPLSRLPPLTRGDRQSLQSPLTSLQWIRENIPCFKGRISPEWTGTVIAKLREQGVPGPAIGKALVIARGLGYDFGVTIESAQLGYDLVPGAGAPPGAGSPGPRTEDPMVLQERLKFLSAQLENAQVVGDDERAATLAQQVAWLQYYLDLSAGGGAPSSSDPKATVPGDTPRSDGLQSERQGGAPLAPPPQNTGRPPVIGRGPLPTPDRPLPPPSPGPYRMPGR